MKKFLRDNSYFFLGYLFFFILGGILLTQIQTADAIFFFSERRTPSANMFFAFFTKMGEEVLYAIFFISLFFVRVRYALMIPLIGVVVSLVSYGAKRFFSHDRPLMYLENKGLAEQVNFVDGIALYTGQTSFPSGHTMSAFALYGFIAFILSGKRMWGLVLFVIALLIGISRIYLVQHFFKDIYAGAFLGVLLAMVFYFAQNSLKTYGYNWLNQPIIGKKKTPRA